MSIAGFVATARLYRFSSSPPEVGYLVEPADGGRGAPLAVLVAGHLLQLEIGRAGCVRINARSESHLLRMIPPWIRGVLGHRVVETIWYSGDRVTANEIVVDPDWSRVTAHYSSGLFARYRADRREQVEYDAYARQP